MRSHTKRPGPEPRLSGGAPLEPDLTRAMEARFQHHFGDVRVFDDAAAHERVSALGAGAYTLGHEIHFAADQFNPASTAGRGLLAHELAHVVQQRGASPTSNPRRSQPGEALEVEAERASSAALFGASVSLSSSEAILACGPPLTLPPTGPGVPPGEIPPEFWEMPRIPGETPFRPPITPALEGGGEAVLEGTGEAVAEGAVAEGVGLGALRYLGPVGAFLGTMLYSSPTAPAWMDEMNPVTGRPYSSEAEYRDVRRMNEAQRQAARAGLHAPGAATAPASDPGSNDPVSAPGDQAYGPPLPPDWHPPMIDPGSNAPPMSAMPTYRGDGGEDDEADDNRTARRQRQPQRQGQEQVTDEPATTDGTPGDNQAQNAQVDEAMRIIQSRLQRSFSAEEYARVRGALHGEVTGQNMGLDGLVETGMGLVRR